MKKKSIKKMVSIFLSALLICTLSTTAFASEKVVSETTLSDYIETQNGLYVVNPKISALGLSKLETDVVYNMITEYNQLIEEGYYDINDNGELASNNLLRSGGKNLISANPQQLGGFIIWLDNDMCKKVSKGLDLTGALASLIPNPALAVAVALALIWNSDSISEANEGNGVVFDYYNGIISNVRAQ